MWRIGVIGSGSMGQNHARVIWELSDKASLIGVVDMNFERASIIAQKYHSTPYEDSCKFLDHEKPDAIILSLPTTHHYSLAMECINRGVHLLIEKPITNSVEEGRSLIKHAKAKGIKLMVGHIERFNPAITLAKQKIEKRELGNILLMEARRQGPFPSRIADVGVSVDLAVHDIDVFRFISSQEIQLVFAQTSQFIHEKSEDLLAAVLRLSGGAIGLLNINWLTPTKIRELYILGEQGMFLVNYIAQDLIFYKNAYNSMTNWDSMELFRGVSEGEMIRYPVKKYEPLRAEIEAFLDALNDKISIPVSGEDGVIAVEIAQAIIQSAINKSSVNVF